MGQLTDEILYGGPQCFSVDQIRAETDLFAERSALFYTPTKNIPPEWVGEGVLDVFLPLVSPSSFSEVREVRWYETPRLWVDLLQRTTGKLRWRPFRFAQVTIVRYDYRILSRGDAYAGLKPLIDALKVQTYGRPDGRLLYYFGAILDDDLAHISERLEQERIQHLSEAKTRIIVQSA